MFETMEQVETFFENRKAFGIKPGLDRINQLLQMQRNPQNQIEAIHIAGTNGKGSTLHYLSDALQANDYQVGVFTSPSFSGLRGHIFMNHTPITEAAFIRIFNEVYPAIQQLDREQMHPTEFEIITVMGFVYFAKYVDIAIIETGMGGREDTTNCFQPIVSIITNVAKDHTAFLGDTIAEIASHKAGIIKESKPVIIGDIKQEALEVITTEARLKQTTVYQLGDTFSYEFIEHGIASQRFLFHYDPLIELQAEIQMLGEHQVKNASIAIMALVKLVDEGYRIQWKHALAAIKETVIPGRFEVIQHNPTIIVDGAHNPAGIQSFLQTVLANDEQTEKHLIFAAFQDKELKTMLDELCKYFTSLTLTSFDHPRAASADELYRAAKCNNKKKVYNWEDAMNNIEKQTDHRYFITGSLHFITDVRKFLGKK